MHTLVCIIPLFINIINIPCPSATAVHSGICGAQVFRNALFTSSKPVHNSLSGSGGSIPKSDLR